MGKEQSGSIAFLSPFVKQQRLTFNGGCALGNWMFTSVDDQRRASTGWAKLSGKRDRGVVWTDLYTVTSAHSLVLSQQRPKTMSVLFDAFLPPKLALFRQLSRRRLDLPCCQCCPFLPPHWLCQVVLCEHVLEPPLAHSRVTPTWMLQKKPSYAEQKKIAYEIEEKTVSICAVKMESVAQGWRFPL